MKIHEYQAKQLLRQAGVKVLPGQVASTPEEAAQAFEALDVPVAVVKAQIHAGGRGKGTFKEHPQQRGVQLVRSAEEAAQVAGRMLGHTLVTAQTGPEGKTVHRVLVEAGCEIQRELYLGIVLDRALARPVLMVCGEGGVEIEQIAAQRPEAILKEAFHPDRGLAPYQARKLARALQLPSSSLRSAERFMCGLSRVFLDYDCSLAEINPLVLTAQGELVALDAKINFDDNALFRHPALADLRDLSEEDPMEVRASQSGLSYVKLEGNIGCLVNGAGLAMATMDLIKLHGGEPANFLDVGGGANVEQVTEAFRILLADPNVKAVLVNIFGGIMRCTTIAQALVQAHKTLGIQVPVVVRLEGTEVEEGRRILEQSGVELIPAQDLTDAAQKVVAALKN